MPLQNAAIGIIFNEDRTEVLLVRRKDMPIWVLPGGGIDAHESPEDAATREVYEETGYKVAIEKKSGEYTPTNRMGKFTTVFVCKILGGSPQVSSETSAVGFFPVDALPALFFPVHKYWVDDALTHKEVVKAIIKGASYTDLIRYIFMHPKYCLRYFLTRLSQPK